MAKVTRLPRNEGGIATVLGVLKQQFGDRFQTGDAIREQHGHTTTWLENQSPDGVVFAQNKEDIVEIVKICATHKVPIIPFGTGTSLEGPCERACRWYFCRCNADEQGFGCVCR